MKKHKEIFQIIILALFFLFLIIFIIRLLNHRELDDVSPEIPCSEEIIEKSDVLWITPAYKNNLISNNPEWCKKISSLNKTLGLHGVYHNYNEFSEDKTQEYLNFGIIEFEKCFNKTPDLFKPPQLKISKNNKALIKSNNLKLKLGFNQFIHKVYHCNDSGKLSNRFVDIY